MPGNYVLMKAQLAWTAEENKNESPYVSEYNVICIS